MNPRDLWLQFRLGHGTYLSLAVQLSNFVIITYTLFLSQFGTGLGMFEFVLLFGAAYVPVAIAIGRNHVKHQYATENRAIFDNNPAVAGLWRLHLEMTEGRADPGEVARMIEYLKGIERNGK